MTKAEKNKAFTLLWAVTLKKLVLQNPKLNTFKFQTQQLWKLCFFTSVKKSHEAALDERKSSLFFFYPDKDSSWEIGSNNIKFLNARCPSVGCYCSERCVLVQLSWWRTLSIIFWPQPCPLLSMIWWRQSGLAATWWPSAPRSSLPFDLSTVAAAALTQSVHIHFVPPPLHPPSRHPHTSEKDTSLKVQDPKSREEELRVERLPLCSDSRAESRRWRNQSHFKCPFPFRRPNYMIKDQQYG